VKPRSSRIVSRDDRRGTFELNSANCSVGYVEFRNPGSVSEAISMTGQRLLGIPIIVQITEAEKNRQARMDAQAAYAPGSHKLSIVTQQPQRKSLSTDSTSATSTSV
jgi:hypothetical protein